jgi:hypothetical protein
VPNNSLVDIARRNALYAGMEHQAPQQKPFASDRSALLNGLASMAAFVPGLGDVAGLAADADMYATDPKSRNWRNYLLTGLGALPFVGGASLLGRATRNVPTGFGNQDGMITYHGSPHRINNVDEANPVGKFDLSKVGTGEGAQAYGHGVYLAENPAVAREYAGALSSARANQPVGRVDLTEAYQHLPGDVPDSVISARGDFRELRDAGVLDPSDRRDFLQAVRNNIDAGKGGNFYTVDLPDEHIAKMLDWDAPLSEQPKAVQEALAAVDPDFYKPGSPDYDPMETGQMIYQRILHDRRNNAIARGANADTTLPASQAQASEWLRSLGIPGIRYFDAGSRTAGDGTRNFVIFDGDTAKILKRE